MKAVVFANADIEDYGFCDEYIKDAVIISCDGGMRHTMKLGIVPDYIVGDFDSVSPDYTLHGKSRNLRQKGRFGFIYTDYGRCYRSLHKGT